MASDRLPYYLELTTVSGFALGAAVALVALRTRISARSKLRFGLWLQILGGLILSLAEHSTPIAPGHVIHSPSAVVAWVALFALAVPAPFGWVLGGALGGAAMAPLGLWLNVLAANVPYPTAAQWWLRFFPVFAVAGWAAFLSRLLYELGTEVQRTKELGFYHLEERIGRGGMGEVWRATYRLLARPTAIKLIREDIVTRKFEHDSQAALRRFEREAKALAMLHCPHTIALYDYGRTEAGSVYYAMELLAGYDLDSFVKRFGPMPPARAVPVLRQISLSLAEAHSVGILHRDIKPSNLFLCVRGLESDFVKVLDFGLAKALVPDETSLATATGAAVGTLGFMAPEMIRGDSEVDARADLYSLGCVAYWLLTGEPVFPNRQGLGVAVAHVREAPAPPSQKAPISDALNGLVLQCLEKDPDDRPASVREFMAALSNCGLTDQWTDADADRWWTLHGPQPDQLCRQGPARPSRDSARSPAAVG
jgi:serine/threonine-protein kinase